MKRFLFLIATVSLLSLTSCKGKQKDEDIQKSAVAALAADPNLSGLNVTVDKGVATITGEVKDESAKTAAGAAVSGVKGVKSVNNNTTVFVAPSVVPPTADETLQKSVNDAIKDYPGVRATVMNQEVVLTGEVARADLQKLMMALNSLKSAGLKSIDSKALVKK
jgi:osmotically-inducible protein OsmY